MSGRYVGAHPPHHLLGFIHLGVLDHMSHFQPLGKEDHEHDIIDHVDVHQAGPFLLLVLAGSASGQGMRVHFEEQFVRGLLDGKGREHRTQSNQGNSDQQTFHDDLLVVDEVDEVREGGMVAKQPPEAQILGLKIKVLHGQVIPLVPIEVDLWGLFDGIGTAFVACFFGKFTIRWKMLRGR